MRQTLLVLLACGASLPFASAQTSTPTVPKQPAALTVATLGSGYAGYPPEGTVWSSDGRVLSFIAEAPLAQLPAAKPGDIVQVDAATGKFSVLVPAGKISALSADAINEQQRDHRERYSMPDYLWSPDSHSLLLDRAGKLWLWSFDSGKAALVADTESPADDAPAFSPNGRTVSFLREGNLYVHPVGAGDATQLTFTPPNAAPGTILNGDVDWLYLEELYDLRSAQSRTNYHWSPDSKSIAYLQMDESKVPQTPIEDFLPVHSAVFWQRYPQPGDPNPAVRVGVVSTAGGPTTWVNVPLSENNDYIPRFGWVNDHTLYIEVLERDHKHLRFYLADSRSGESHLLYTESDPKYLEEYYNASFLPDGRFLLVSWQDGHNQLYVYGFDAQHPLTTHAHLLHQLTRGDYEVQSFDLARSTGTVFFTSTEGSPLETHLWEVQLDGTGKRELDPAAGSHRTTVSPEGKYFSDEVSTLDTPPQLNLCPVSNSTTCTMLWKATHVEHPAGVTSRIVTFKAADHKTTLYGILTEPTAASGAHSIPVILNPYGGPSEEAGIDNTWYGYTAQFNDLLAQHGFAVLNVDNRGSGGRGREFEQANYHDFGKVQLADQLAALDQLLASDQRLDPNRVGWWGWSWGGYFTLYAMTHTDRIRAGVAVAPVTNFRDYDTAYTERYLGVPTQDDTAYKTSDIDTVAGHLRGHILIVHGTGDDNVHIENTMQFVQGLIDAEVPYDLQIFPRLTHSLSGPAARNELFNRIVFQFDTYLKPEPR